MKKPSSFTLLLPTEQRTWLRTQASLQGISEGAVVRLILSVVAAEFEEDGNLRKRYENGCEAIAIFR